MCVRTQLDTGERNILTRISAFIRSHAVSGRIIHDLYDLSDVLCNLLILTIATIRPLSRPQPYLARHVHNAILSLLARSSFPSECVRTPDSYRPLPQHVRDGVQPEVLIETEGADA